MSNKDSDTVGVNYKTKIMNHLNKVVILKMYINLGLLIPKVVFGKRGKANTEQVAFCMFHLAIQSHKGRVKIQALSDSKALSFL